MHHVLLVDDEPAVTSSLQHEIDWSSLGLSVIAIAKNGVEALDIIQKNTVDIVITDIRMAAMDGLTLSRQIYLMNQNIQIIIISGYAEFSYAQKALSYGVLGYCLKPVEFSEMTRYLQLAIRKLESQKQGSDYDDLLDAMYNGEVEETRLHLKNLGFSAELYHVAVSVSKKPLPTGKGKRIVLQLGHRHYGYLLTAPFSLQMIEASFARTGCSGFAFSEKPVPVPRLGTTLRQLSNKSFHYFFEPDRKVIANAPNVSRLSCANELVRLTSGNDLSQLLSLLESLKENAANTMTLHCAWQLYNIIATSDSYGSIVAADDIFTPEQLVFHYGTFSGMIDTLCGRLKEFSPQQTGESISNAAFLHAVRYIDAHLTEGCTLQQLAAEMNMHANYLGQIFKKETGKTYTTYVTELRIEKAKEMLDSKVLSISEIASLLGFNDYFYFLKTFKRVVGMTPKQYRQGFGNNFLYSETEDISEP